MKKFEDSHILGLLLVSMNSGPVRVVRPIMYQTEHRSICNIDSACHHSAHREGAYDS